jgi:hypothetical protein
MVKPHSLSLVALSIGYEFLASMGSQSKICRAPHPMVGLKWLPPHTSTAFLSLPLGRTVLKSHPGGRKGKLGWREALCVTDPPTIRNKTPLPNQPRGMAGLSLYAVKICRKTCKSTNYQRHVKEKLTKK